MKTRWFTIALLVGIGIVVCVNVAFAQEETPPPYAGLENPFPWDDKQAQEVGRKVYEQSCRGCHGRDGSSISDYNFSLPEYSKTIETRPDFIFWVISEGRRGSGMPAYKSTLSEEQIWQVITYMHMLGKTEVPFPPTEIPGPNGTSQPPVVKGKTLTVVSLSSVSTGQEISFTAYIWDSDNQPIGGDLVKFYMVEDFVTRGLVYIGEANTNEEGIAFIFYTPVRPGDTTIIARSGQLEDETQLNVSDSGMIFYHSQGGLDLPSFGPEIFIGPDGAHELGELGNAPVSALWLPGGLISWLWLFIGVVGLVWGTYFIVIYQVFNISRDNPRDTNAKIIPVAALILIVLMGIIALLMVLTGPYSHFHLAS